MHYKIFFSHCRQITAPLPKPVDLYYVWKVEEISIVPRVMIRCRVEEFFILVAYQVLNLHPQKESNTSPNTITALQKEFQVNVYSFICYFVLL